MISLTLVTHKPIEVRKCIHLTQSDKERILNYFYIFK